ncbi:MAG: FlgD immunoglobulin-like domain containing protein [Candidatus Cloacimonadota bacterium]|nr:FlgD immunoglobulin-like domain containing protein [Candidatus Cloacimonadota bacterium]
MNFRGDLYVGDNGMPWIPPYVPNATFRSYLTFLLDSLNVSRIDSVKLRLRGYYHGNDTLYVWPIWDIPNGDTIKLCIDHVDYGDYLDVGDWTAGNPGDPQTLQSKFCFITPEHQNPEHYFFIDVTDAILNDIHNQRDKSQFRIRFEISTDMDSLCDDVVFTYYNTTSIKDRPHLLIYYHDSTAVEHQYELSTNQILLENYPNPFNQETTIQYQLPSNIKNSFLEIFNIKGQLVKTIVNEHKEKGYYTEIWDGRNDNGKKLANGIYFYKIKIEGKSRVKKMLLLR